MSDRAEEVAKKLNEEFRYRPFHDYSDMIAAAIRAYAEEAVRVWRGDLWLAHGHSGIIYGDDGEMACSACGVDYKRESNSSRVVAAALHARAEEAVKQWIEQSNPVWLERIEEVRREERKACCRVICPLCAKGLGVSFHQAVATWVHDGVLLRCEAHAIRARGEGRDEVPPLSVPRGVLGRTSRLAAEPTPLRRMWMALDPMTPPTDSLVAALRAVPTLCERSLRPNPGDDDDVEAEPCKNHGEPDYPALAAAVRGWVKEQFPEPAPLYDGRYMQIREYVARRLGLS